ncbi:helix-turn-helix transcriptional regulator [Flavobacterium sp.]|uniref:helix-turn-helix domain-containing protein n=1 Tax=Flavobacterium sp. TaxID=239 RepID=UPI00262CC4C2|nr:helix-turn-helix transcriptional regulator [Flavobacterium sp.]MDD3004842.1 helix-turn-helix transcriptional regulator [Flavobacterium sp.]
MIGERIRKIRSLKGYSQDYMSDLLEISQSAYSDIEKNKSKIDFQRVQKIAEIFEVELNDLISFDENQVFNNTFNEKSNGFFNVEKVITESFDKERISYQEQIIFLKEEILYLRKKLDEKKLN